MLFVAPHKWAIFLAVKYEVVLPGLMSTVHISINDVARSGSGFWTPPAPIPLSLASAEVYVYNADSESVREAERSRMVHSARGFMRSLQPQTTVVAFLQFIYHDRIIVFHGPGLGLVPILGKSVCPAVFLQIGGAGVFC